MIQSPAAQYMITEPARMPHVPRTTHIVYEWAEWGTDGLCKTLCSVWKRGHRVDGPTAEYPLCPRCETRQLKGYRHL